MSKVDLSDKIKIGKMLDIHAKCSILNLSYDLNDYYEISWFEKTV